MRLTRLAWRPAQLADPSRPRQRAPPETIVLSEQPGPGEADAGAAAEQGARQRPLA